MAIAASVALLGTALFFWTRPSAEDRTFAGFQNRMTAFAVRQYSMDFRTRDLQEARNRLAALNAPSDFQLTAGLSAAPVKGGAKLSWQGTPVTMVCFDGPDAKILYLFIVPSQTFDSAPGEGKLETVKGLACATWSSAGKTYLLAADIPKQELRAYL